MLPQNATYLYVTAFLDELARAGVRQACLCPGSRSTPLALRLAADPRFKIWMHLDERSAAFFGLGLAKAQRHPVVLLCTSGTAAANFMPAVVEAHYGRVPLIVLTADRPPELRGTGAPQTIDQIKLYGAYAKWFVEMALPEATADHLRYVRTVAGRAVAEALAAPAGAVHLNFPFREPLVPLPGEAAVPPHEAEVYHGRADGLPYAQVLAGRRQAEASSVATLAAQLGQLKRGIIIAGPQTDPEFPPAVARLARRLGYPVLADPLSQARCGVHHGPLIVDAYDAFLRDAATVDRLAPEVILRFGAMPTSRPVLLYLQRHAGARQILVDDGHDWPDAARVASDVVGADAGLFCEALAEALVDSGESESEWAGLWQAVNCRARDAAQAHLQTFADMFEGRVFSELAACLPDRATCFVSSSMPVRDLDTFFPGDRRQIRFLANRGANGIDGVVSSALGAGAASDDPLVLVIGDLALYHDLNGLLAARQHRLNATIVLVNNDGGGIFSFLPQAAYPEHFEQLFGTPHGLDFRPAAEMYGAAFHPVADWPAFREAVSQGLASDGLSLVEVRTDRELNVQMHRAVWQAVAASLQTLA